MTERVCPACNTKNDESEEYCLNCGQKLIETNKEEKNPSKQTSNPKGQNHPSGFELHPDIQFLANQTRQAAPKDLQQKIRT